MRWARCIRSWAALLLVASPALANEGELPDFASCLSQEMARFERVVATEPFDAGDDLIAIYGVSGVEFCGTVGIVRCDRSENPLGCQNGLAVRQDILRAHVLDQLPAPAQVASSAAFSSRLYEITHALAHGTSAGQDCAGYQPVLEMWCRAREANGRLRAAVLAWQVARHMHAVSPAFEAGWVRLPEPTRPRSRPGAQE